VDPRDDNRLLAHRLLWLQAGAGLAAAGVGLAFWGRNVGISALAGAFIGVVANLYMTLRGLQPASTPRGALGRLYFGQLVKMAVGVALLIVAVKYLPHVSVPALLSGFIATLVVVWFVPFASVARTRRGDGGSGAG
jgi:F0F1-type ATP synthase assembly protein I